MSVIDSPCIYRPIRWSSAITVQPTLEPVSLEEMKAHGVYDFADDDALVAGFIVAARRRVEALTQRALMTQTRTLKLDRFPPREDALIELPGGKSTSVTSIAYTDTAGASQTWSSAEYVTDFAWEPARIGLAYNEDWPDVREWDLPITITYVCGYGSSPADVPEELRLAIKMAAAEMYERREEATPGQVMVPNIYNAKALAASYRVNWVY